MILRAQRWLLGLFGRLPGPLRRRVVRAASPTYVVGAACVIEHDGALLLVRHSYMRGWGLAGGGLHRREVPEAAAVREVAEEVGLAVEPAGAVRLVIDAPRRRLDIVVPCRLAAGAAPADACTSSPEIVEVRWVPREEVPSLRLHPSAEAVLREAGVVTRR